MYLISYDIASDKLRRKVAKCLENYGKRMQYSVFECDLSDDRYKRMYRELLDIAGNLSEGSIRFYYICGKCYPRLSVIGIPKPSVIDEIDSVIII